MCVLGMNSVSSLEGEENGGLRSHYQELLWFRRRGQCRKAGTCTVWVTKVYLKVWCVLRPQKMCQQIPEAHFLHFFHTQVFLLIPHYFCSCRVPNSLISLGKRRAEETFMLLGQQMLEGEARGLCTGRG